MHNRKDFKELKNLSEDRAINSTKTYLIYEVVSDFYILNSKLLCGNPSSVSVEFFILFFRYFEIVNFFQNFVFLIEIPPLLKLSAECVSKRIKINKITRIN